LLLLAGVLSRYFPVLERASKMRPVDMHARCIARMRLKMNPPSE